MFESNQIFTRCYGENYVDDNKISNNWYRTMPIESFSMLQSKMCSRKCCMWRKEWLWWLFRRIWRLLWYFDEYDYQIDFWGMIDKSKVDMIKSNFIQFYQLQLVQHILSFVETTNAFRIQRLVMEYPIVTIIAMKQGYVKVKWKWWSTAK